MNVTCPYCGVKIEGPFEGVFVIMRCPGCKQSVIVKNTEDGPEAVWFNDAQKKEDKFG